MPRKLRKSLQNISKWIILALLSFGLNYFCLLLSFLIIEILELIEKSSALCVEMFAYVSMIVLYIVSWMMPSKLSMWHVILANMHGLNQSITLQNSYAVRTWSYWYILRQTNYQWHSWKPYRAVDYQWFLRQSPVLKLASSFVKKVLLNLTETILFPSRYSWQWSCWPWVVITAKRVYMQKIWARCIDRPSC